MRTHKLIEIKVPIEEWSHIVEGMRKGRALCIHLYVSIPESIKLQNSCKECRSKKNKKIEQEERRRHQAFCANTENPEGPDFWENRLVEIFEQESTNAGVAHKRIAKKEMCI